MSEGQQIDYRQLLGPVMEKAIEDLVRGHLRTFRIDRVGYELGIMTIYKRSNVVFGYLGDDTSREIHLALVTRWINPIVGEQRLVIVFEGETLWKAIPLGAVSEEARESTRLTAAKLNYKLVIPPLPDGEWNPRPSRYVVVNFNEKFTAWVNGKRAMLSNSRGPRITPPLKVPVLCEVHKEDGFVVSLRPYVPITTGDAAHKLAANLNNPAKAGETFAGVAAAKPVDEQPLLESDPFQALGLESDASREAVSQTFKRLKNATSFGSEAEAEADPVIIALVAGDYDLTRLPIEWWRSERFIEDRFEIAKQARDQCYDLIRARPAPAPAVEVEPSPKRQRIADPFAALGIAPDTTDKAAIRAAAKALKDKSFANEQEANADPMFAAMRAIGFDLSWSDAKSVLARSRRISGCTREILDAIDAQKPAEDAASQAGDSPEPVETAPDAVPDVSSEEPPTADVKVEPAPDPRPTDSASEAPVVN